MRPSVVVTQDPEDNLEIIAAKLRQLRELLMVLRVAAEF
jgi:hypothetical protein